MVLHKSCNTQINRLSAPEFPCIYQCIRDVSARAWQIQLTVPMGNAADNADIFLQPYELLDIYSMLARVARRAYGEGVNSRREITLVTTVATNGCCGDGETSINGH
ncbi:MAG: hypothetical protein ACHBN1_27260 [Heteroscytonema crispum UTEX LB 1556]